MIRLRRLLLNFGVIALLLSFGPKGLAQNGVVAEPLADEPAVEEIAPQPNESPSLDVEALPSVEALEAAIPGSPNDCCGVATCGVLDGCCQPCCPTAGGWVAGAGFYYVQPHFESNPAYAVTSSIGFEVSLGREEHFSGDYEFAPVVWLGYSTGDGAGVRVRNWRFDQNAQLVQFDYTTVGIFDFITTQEVLGVNFFTIFTSGATFAMESDLKLDVWDFEGMFQLQSCRWTIQGSGGVRYAHLSQSYNAFAVTPGEDALSSGLFGLGTAGAILSGHSFNGAGPTVAIDVRRSIGCSGLSIYGLGRGSILFGHRRHLANSVLIDLAGNVSSLAGASSELDKVISVGELELGAEWATVMAGYRVTLQSAVVAQIWNGADNASRANLPTQFGVPAFGTGETNTNLGFFGVMFSAGVDF